MDDLLHNVRQVINGISGYSREVAVGTLKDSLERYENGRKESQGPSHIDPKTGEKANVLLDAVKQYYTERSSPIVTVYQSENGEVACRNDFHQRFIPIFEHVTGKRKALQTVYREAELVTFDGSKKQFEEISRWLDTVADGSYSVRLRPSTGSTPIMLHDGTEMVEMEFWEVDTDMPKLTIKKGDSLAFYPETEVVEPVFYLDYDETEWSFKE